MSKSTFVIRGGASKRMEALSDGIFAIAATLLVLEIRVPELSDSSTPRMMNALTEILPSFIGFIFSFLNIIIFWVNHDTIGKVTERYDTRLTYLNIIFLLFISLIPFTAAFISRYPFNIISVTAYGTVLLITAIIATIMYRHIAFGSDLMMNKITMKSKKKIFKRVLTGPFLFAIAILLGFINVIIPILIYVIAPLLFLALPGMEFEEN